jgi:hypothetical protein
MSSREFDPSRRAGDAIAHGTEVRSPSRVDATARRGPVRTSLFAKAMRRSLCNQPSRFRLGIENSRS